MKIKDLEPIVQDVLDQQPKAVKEYKTGKTGLIGMFAGQVMLTTKGKANPKDIMTIIKEKLK